MSWKGIVNIIINIYKTLMALFLKSNALKDLVLCSVLICQIKANENFYQRHLNRIHSHSLIHHDRTLAVDIICKWGNLEEKSGHHGEIPHDPFPEKIYDNFFFSR